MEKEESIRTIMQQVSEGIDNGKLTINQARKKCGLKPINSPGADILLLNLETKNKGA